jgi:hypothetical protein
MKNLIILIIISVFIPSLSYAGKVVTYKGTAMKRNRLAYTENHVVKYDKKGKLISAETTYKDPEGKVISILKSDFRKSLTAPDHIIKDFRTGNVQGLRINPDNIILFNHDLNEKEEVKELKNEPGDDRLAFGCQGLNYYLLKNLDSFKKKKKIPIKFLIPGKLTAYDFEVEYMGESKDGIVDIEIKIQSWLLKIFAPKLKVKYDQNKQRIIWYKGLSNITDKRGRDQKVIITYEYSD